MRPRCELAFEGTMNWRVAPLRLKKIGVLAELFQPSGTRVDERRLVKRRSWGQRGRAS